MKPFERVSRSSQGRDPVGGDLEVAFGLAATFSGRLAGPRRHKSLPFQALERRVQCTHRWRTPRYRIDFGSDHGAVRTFAEANDGQQYDMLELAEVLAFRHNACIIGDIARRVKLGQTAMR
jgi:hypothetical protein